MGKASGPEGSDDEQEKRVFFFQTAKEIDSSVKIMDLFMDSLVSTE